MPTPEAIARDADALLTSAGLRLRDDLVLVHVLGDDRLSWLNGQITADARKASAAASVYALAVTVRGKIMADLWVLARGEELAVLLPESALQSVLESFEHQIIMDDVTLRRDDDVAVLSLQGPRASDALAMAGFDAAEVEHHACDELGTGGVFVLAPRARRDATLARLRAAAEGVGGGLVSTEGFELARLRRGRPRFAADFGPEHYPQEAGLEDRAVAFDKGCYLGQEVVCTLESRGRLTRRLVRLAGRDASAQPGTALTTPAGATIGSVTSAAAEPDGTVHALGYAKRAQAAEGAELLADGTPWRVVGDAR